MRSQSAEDARLIARATRLFLTALPRRVRFAVVAHALGVTTAELAAAYQRQGQHPRDHLRRTRLAHLHADLEAGRVATAVEGLIRWGFPGASSDAIDDYRRRYGCTPEQTLGRAGPG